MQNRVYKNMNISLEEACELIRAYTPCGRKTETVGLDQALGRYTAEDYASPVDQPAFPRSPLDGYALRACDSRGASEETPVTLSVVDEVMAGQVPAAEVKAFQAARIMTGAPVPAGADCVIRQEDTDRGREAVRIYKALSGWENYCQAGEDFKKGQLLVRKNTKITASVMAAFAAMGQEKISVVKMPKAALFTTGDELILPGKELPPGKIYNSNLFFLSARLQELGIRPVICRHLPDDAAGLARALRETSEQADLIITTGGVSVGQKDILHEALTFCGADKIFWRIRLKPGMPTIFSLVNDVPVISLSGNPYGAIVNLELLVRPALACMTGIDDLLPKTEEAVLETDFQKGSGVPRYVRAFTSGGRVSIPDVLHSSGVIGSLQGCNSYVLIPADRDGRSGAEKGDRVSVIML